MNPAACNTPATSVLVVDDDEFSRDVLSAMLATAGITEIHCADNGRSALRAMAGMATLPGLLICDVFMPDMDGIEFMSTLADQGYSGGVVLVSGVDLEMLSMARDIAVANGIKVLGCHTKPLSKEALIEALQG